jgi:hypothetical protein
MLAFEELLVVFFWLWIGYTSAFTVVVWIGLLARERELERPSVPFLIWPIASLFGVAGLLGIARIWAIAMRPEDDLIDSLAFIVGILLAGASFSLRLVRGAIAKREFKG